MSLRSFAAPIKIMPVVAVLLAGGCGQDQKVGVADPVLCCYDIVYLGINGKISATRCNGEPICPTPQDGTVFDVCVDLCQEIDEIRTEGDIVPWPASWGTAPSDYAGTISSCMVNSNMSEKSPGAGGDEAGGGQLCGGNAHGATPLLHDAARSEVVFDAQSSGAVSLSIAGFTQQPDYTGRVLYRLDNCVHEGGKDYCDMVLQSLFFETTDSMSFGGYDVEAAVGMLQRPVITRVSMISGEFAFSDPNQLEVGVVWERPGESFEHTAFVNNGGAVLHGNLDVHGPVPTMMLSGSFPGEFGGVAGALSFEGIVGEIINSPPVADPSRSDMLAECVPGAAGGVEVELDARASHDLDDNITGYLWRVDGEDVRLGSYTTVLLTAGFHDVELLVHDAAGASSLASFVVDVEDPLGECASVP